MNKNTIFIAALLWLFASLTQAATYIGTGAGYHSFTINQVSGINTAERALFVPPFFLVDVDLPDIYADDYRGLSFLAGYRFDDSPWAVEFNYFRSASERASWQGEIGSVIGAETKIRLESFSVDVIGRYPFSSLNKISLLGTAGVLHQQVNIVRQYNLLIATLMHSGEVFDGAGGTRVNEKDISDTRLQLGIGMQYDISDALSARAMLSAIPAGFSISDGTPYSLNTTLLYHF